MPFALYMQAANAGYIGLFPIIQRFARSGIRQAVFPQIGCKFYFCPAPSAKISKIKLLRLRGYSAGIGAGLFAGSCAAASAAFFVQYLSCCAFTLLGFCFAHFRL